MSVLDRLGPVPVGILWRLDNGELDGINPKLVVLLAGTNNLNLKSKLDPTLKASTPDE